MKVLRENLLLQFSLVSLLVLLVMAVAIGFLIMDSSLTGVALAVGLLLLYGGLISIAWRGWTARKRAEETRGKLEEELMQAQKLESVGRLAGGVAHEFNNLLTPIIAYANLLKEKTPPGDTVRNGLEEIEKAAIRASALVSQLLSFSRRQDTSPKVINLNNIVQDVAGMLRTTIGKDIELVILPGSGLKPIKADPYQIQQVLLNLIINARDALLNGGKITIETSNLSLDATRLRDRNSTSPQGWITLAVSDNGCGMTKEIKAHIFEPFFTTKDLGRGSGLGLATCHGMISQIGGDIEVSSELDEGTRFTIYLPTVDEEVSRAYPSESQGPLPHGTETILLAEDEPLVRPMIATMLKELGYTVLEADNGEEAIRLAQRNGRGEISLLLTDIVMPRMGGFELSEKFIVIHPDTPVILTSGYSDGLSAKVKEIGDDFRFIPKPFTLPVLASTIRETLDNNGSREVQVNDAKSLG